MAGRKALPPRKRLRTLFAFVLAPLATALLTTAVGFGVAMANGARNLNMQGVAQAGGIIAFWLFAFMIVIGWPLQAVAFRLRWRAAPTYIAAGAIGGVVLAGGLFALFWVQTRNSTELHEPLAYLGAALAFAIVIVLPTIVMEWLFWLIRRPDKDRDADPLHVFD